MPVLVTGASGFVGSALIPRLQAEGVQVRALARSAERVDRALALERSLHRRQEANADPPELVVGDALTGAGLDRALAGVEVAYYLIHSMERSGGEDFPERERRAAENFAAAAVDAGVQRVIYLGGPLPAEGAASRHLASRHAVEEILMSAAPASVTLRASILIGARSRSFRFLVRLVENMPVLALPAWRAHRTAPIDSRDVLELLVAAARSSEAAGRRLEAGGPEVLSYGQMIARIAELMLVARPTLRLPVSLTPVAGVVAAAITREEPDLIVPLMESLEGDLLPEGEDAAALLKVPLHSFDSAVERGLRDLERLERVAAR